MNVPSKKNALAILLTALLFAAPAVAEDPKTPLPPSPEKLQEQIQQQEQRILELERLLKQQGLLLDVLRQQLQAQANAYPTTPNSASAQTPATQQPTSQQEMERLSGEVDALADSSQELQQRVNQLQKKTDDAEKTTGNKLKGLGNFSFSGDVRLRYEPFIGGGVETAPAPTQRHRERFRLRFNTVAKFSDEWTGGLSIASGDVGDPISTNQTMTGFFVRKPILIDRAFVEYRPKWFKPLTLTGGKFAYTWYRTELTWDNDLNPEGLSEGFQWNWKDRRLQRLALVAFQLAANELSAGRDSAVFGGQLQTNWKLHNRVKLGAHIGFLDYRRPDAIAANQSPGGGATGSTGSFGGSNFTNFSGLISGSRTYASRFAVLDAIARLDFDTGLKRFPLMLQLDYVQNTRACGNLGRFVAAGVVPPNCDPSERHGYWSEIQFGRTQERGDMRFGYTLIRVERDAVVSAFDFSDLRQATNVVNHRLEYIYQLNNNVQVGFTGLIGRQLRTSSSPSAERWLKRLQFDVLYKF